MVVMSADQGNGLCQPEIYIFNSFSTLPHEDYPSVFSEQTRPRSVDLLQYEMNKCTQTQSKQDTDYLLGVCVYANGDKSNDLDQHIL